MKHDASYGMSTPAEPFARAQAKSVHQWIEFIRSELGLCLTFGFLAAIKFQAGNRYSAERSLDHAEETYTTLLLFLSNPARCEHLSAEQIQEFTGEAKWLRERLDRLQQFKRCSRARASEAEVKSQCRGAKRARNSPHPKS